MSCPVCENTMVSIGELKMSCGRAFHCERCGTLLIRGCISPDYDSDAYEDVYTPKIVERAKELALHARKFNNAAHLPGMEKFVEFEHLISTVLESCCLPEERK